MPSGLDVEQSSPDWLPASSDVPKSVSDARNIIMNMLSFSSDTVNAADLVDSPQITGPANRDALLVLLPLLIILSSLLFLLLLFLVCVILLRRRRGISLRDGDGPIDLSREELIDGEGGFDVIEDRWLESVDEDTQRSYRRAKDYQTQYPPNSLPTDITLSQFLSIQEKGVSAWSFDPDYETNASVLVHARTEITFLPDPFSSSCVQSNLPLPKVNEVYYWEVKMFDLPETTSIGVGLATKPYPAFRLPGLNRFSIAYHSNGDKSHNYPFTAQSYGSPLRRVMFLVLAIVPVLGRLHVNLGQSGFVFIEANVKKWGLAPSVGTLAPPPAYGSERGSILLEAGGGIRPVEGNSSVYSLAATPPSTSRRVSRVRRHRPTTTRSDTLTVPNLPIPQSPPPPITPIQEEGPELGQNSSEQSSRSSSRSRSTSPIARLTPRSGHSRNNSAAEMTGASPPRRDEGDDSSARPPPAYSPLDAYRYSDGVEIDLPAEVIAAALNSEGIPASAVGSIQNDRTRNRRERRR
ncbi:SPRY-domain-containing [Pyrrhoderma noxium]|uniref:SPRY-domain-containing n=1 Tax=Pyrrhoderma noxium TaxID=2282107 RepID=A0A286URR7_9AGAM|nr:SPRY-domain-containing [Pyrrhoderma noxium]